MKEKNNKLNILKRILIVILILVIIIIGATIGNGNYFVNYAISRTGNGGDREIKNEDAVEVANINDETEKIIEENRKEENQLANQWSNDVRNKKVQVTAKDGITLKGTEYIKDEQINDWVIVLHGYHSSPESVISVGMHFSEKGYNVLIPYMRATGKSEGEYIGMGWLDKDDLKCWIDLIVKQNSNSNIVLHGSSMGAATVLMASGDELSKNDIDYYYIDGQTEALERLSLVNKFNEGEDVKVFLISLKAGGSGLNLTSADVVIHFDPWWNPAVENQASD